MSFTWRKLAPAIGAAVEGLDIRRPVSSEAVRELRALWLDHGILLFRASAGAAPEELLRFSGAFGDPEDHDQVQFTLPGHPKVAVVSNVKREGRFIGATKAGRNWHSDSQYLAVPPSGSFLYAHQVPPDQGDTLFASTYAAYDALSEAAKRRIEGLQVNYSRVRAYPIAHPTRPPLSEEEKARLPDVTHPLVRVHPETGRRALYVGGVQHGGAVVGLPPAESDALLTELREFATRPEFVYRHRWREGDAILWDNRCTLHCALPFDEERYDRIMYRTQLAGSVPV